MRATIAHEVYGHRHSRVAGKVHPEDWAEEAQASLRAAKFAPGLTDADRQMLVQDAMERAKKAGKKLTDADLWVEEFKK
jgi:putative NADPH-quinone reductase